MTALNRFDAQYFPTPIIYVLLLFLSASNIARPYAISTCAALSTTDCDALLTNQIQQLIYIPAVSIWILILIWLLSVLVSYVYGEKIHAQYFRWPQWCCYNNTNNSIARVEGSTTKKNPLDDGLLFFRVSFCLSTFAYGILASTYKTGANTFTEFDDRALLSNMIPIIFFELSVIFFDLRLVQYKAVVALLALIEAKKTYVRYISHELRTPLSAANSGLQMLHAELSATASTNPVDEERLDTLTDVCSAIQTTVDILNDLLTFEKMDSGKNSPIDSLLDLI